jgi:hypothetical protein
VDDPMKIDTQLTFSGVTDTDDGGFTAERLSVPDIDTEFSDEPVGRLTLSDIVAEDIYLPPAGAMDTIDLMQSVGRISTGPLSVTRDGADFLAIAGFEASNEFSFDGDDALTDIVSIFEVSGIWADLSSAGEEDPETGAMIEALGLTEINGNISQSMNWNLVDGHMVIDQFLFDFDDVGAIDFKGDISGLTPAVIDKINAMQASTVDPTSEAAQAQQMMLGMELLQAITITGSSLRYDDASLAGRMIDFFAEQSGADRADFVEGLKAMAQQSVSQLGIAALTEMVTPAINAFLDDPQSFEIGVRPPKPTTLLVLSAAAANPAGLISAVGLSVKANQPAE